MALAHRPAYSGSSIATRTDRASAEFSPREIDVLRLVADGYSTDEIARALSYSERTVKNVLHGVTTRFGLRSRSHAVAFALRRGVI